MLVISAVNQCTCTTFLFSTTLITGLCSMGLAKNKGFCVSRMEGRSVRSTERSEARNVATRSEAKGHALIT